MPSVKTLTTCLVTALACAAGLASAQTAPVKPTVLNLRAFASNGAEFTPSRIQGKVAVVFYWSTACAVCRDSLPELRKNLFGWREKPFVLVTVNVDKSAREWLDYERIQGQTQAPPKNLISVRLDEGEAVPTKLPLTLLVDDKGKVISRIEGRLAPEVWDGVADLLP